MDFKVTTGKFYGILFGSLFLVFWLDSDSANPEPNEEGGAGGKKWEAPHRLHSVIPGLLHGFLLWKPQLRSFSYDDA